MWEGEVHSSPSCDPLDDPRHGGVKISGSAKPPPHFVQPRRMAGRSWNRTGISKTIYGGPLFHLLNAKRAGDYLWIMAFATVVQLGDFTALQEHSTPYFCVHVSKTLMIMGKFPMSKPSRKVLIKCGSGRGGSICYFMIVSKKNQSTRFVFWVLRSGVWTIRTEFSLLFSTGYPYY